MQFSAFKMDKDFSIMHTLSFLWENSYPLWRPPWFHCTSWNWRMCSSRRRWRSAAMNGHSACRTWTAAMSSFLCSCSWVWRSPALLPLWDDQCIYIFVTYLVIYSSSCHFKSVWVSVFCWTIFWRMLVTKDLMVPIDFHSIFPPYCKRPWLPSNVCLQNIFFCAQQKLIEVWNNSRMSKLFHLFKVSYGKENYFFSFYQNVLTSPQKTSNVSNNIHI